jgi:hypothetical protein
MSDRKHYRKKAGMGVVREQLEISNVQEGALMDPSTRGLLGHITRWNHNRRPYVRVYPPDSIWRGYLSPMAIAELRTYGNTVRHLGGDRYILNEVIE